MSLKDKDIEKIRKDLKGKTILDVLPSEKEEAWLKLKIDDSFFHIFASDLGFSIEKVTVKNNGYIDLNSFFSDITTELENYNNKFGTAFGYGLNADYVDDDCIEKLAYNSSEMICTLKTGKSFKLILSAMEDEWEKKVITHEKVLDIMRTIINSPQFWKSYFSKTLPNRGKKHVCSGG